MASLAGELELWSALQAYPTFWCARRGGGWGGDQLVAGLLPGAPPPTPTPLLTPHTHPPTHTHKNAHLQPTRRPPTHPPAMQRHGGGQAQRAHRAAAGQGPGARHRRRSVGRPLHASPWARLSRPLPRPAAPSVPPMFRFHVSALPPRPATPPPCHPALQRPLFHPRPAINPATQTPTLCCHPAATPPLLHPRPLLPTLPPSRISTCAATLPPPPRSICSDLHRMATDTALTCVNTIAAAQFEDIKARPGCVCLRGGGGV
jgi:hypothetical protein